MSKRWWVSFSSDVTGKPIGVVLTTTGATQKEVLKHLKLKGIRPAEQHEVLMIEMPKFGASLEADIEWNRLPKDQLITGEKMEGRGYRKTQTSELEANGFLDRENVSHICSDCTK